MPPDTAPCRSPATASARRIATRQRVAAFPVSPVARRARASHRSIALGALLLGGLFVAPAAAGAQRLTPTTGSAAESPPVPSATDSLEEQAAARVADAVCGKRVVLLGELPEHGHARAFGVKARIVERLVTRCGFRAVLFEAGSYEFFGLERAIAATPDGSGGAGAAATSSTNGAPVATPPTSISRRPGSSAGRTDSLELALARAIGGLWWTRELAGWRRWLVQQAANGRVRLGGVDDQPIGATAVWTRATLPGLVGAAVPPARAAECRDAVARHVNWSYTATQPYDGAERARLAECARLAADGAQAARASSGIAADRRTPDQVMLDDLAGYFAREHGSAGAPDRDQAMARNISWWLERLPPDAKLVVWTATTHAARTSGAGSVLPLGVPPMGAQLAERWGDRLAVIGFTALHGEWGRAGRSSTPLAQLPDDALETRALAAGAGGGMRAWAWLDREALRALGPMPSRLFGRIASTDWSEAFDGVLVIREEAAPTFEPRR